jgi:hypothetical protein
MNTVNGQQHKVTAHQLWCNIIQAQLQSLLFPKRVANGKGHFMTSKAECRRLMEESLSAVVTFENTRLRVVVDEMQNYLQAHSTIAENLLREFQRCNRIRFWKRLRLKWQYASAVAVREAYQKAVLVLVNTAPPTEPAAEEPQMKVAR